MLALKSVKINEAFSQETTMFMADIYFNGKKIGYAKNDGHGGSTDYYACEGQRAALAMAEDYAKTLPSPFDANDKNNLEDWIDDEIYKLSIAKANAKANKQIQKACDTNIVWGIPDTGAYVRIGFKGNPKFADLVKTTQGKVALQNLLNKVKKELKPNEVIFNKNLTDLIW
jgi:hypothetical protein